MSGEILERTREGFRIRLPQGEAFLRRDEAVGLRAPKEGDRVESVVSGVEEGESGPRFLFSCASDGFRHAVLRAEAPEIHDGDVRAEAIARVCVLAWSDSQAELLSASLVPAEPSRLVLYEDDLSADVVLPSDKISLASGRCGSNLRLASKTARLEVHLVEDA